MSEIRLHTLRMLARRLKRYGLSAAWLKAEALAGRLPCLKAGRRLLFDVVAVEAALVQRLHKRRKEPTMPQSNTDETTLRLALRPVEAAQLLGISVRHLHNLTKRGEIPHARLGRAVLYPLAGLRLWLESRCTRTGPSDQQGACDE